VVTEKSITDAAQRAQALDVNRSFIVQAPAGSGKTELLTQRYLRLLADVNNPEEIYAITFTRKAAAEMRNRILAALNGATGPQPGEPHRRLTWQLARAALASDAQKDWQIRHNPNRLRVQTFDSLSHALARQMPLLSELGAPPSTTEKAEPYYRDAARATLRRLEDATLGPHLERLLIHLDNRLGQLEDLLCNMLARRDQWLGHTFAPPTADDLEAALDSAITAHLERLDAACTPGWLDRLTMIAQQAAISLAAGRPPLADSLAAWRDRQEIPGCNWQDLPAWLGLAQLLITAQGGARKQWDARLGFPAPSEAGIDPDMKAQRRQAKLEIAALAARLADQPESLAAWAGLRLLPQRGLDAAQQELMTSLFAILLHAAAELQLVFQERGEVDFAEIQMRARQALGRPEAPTDLALVLDYRFQHLLVDEFQDTSSSQYELLGLLTAGWQDGDGRTLFVVGDPMQSIYRFREAEVGLYLQARERGIGQLRLLPLTLEVNFRSTGGIVDWLNTSFPTILPAAIDAGRGAVPYSAAVAYDEQPDAAAVQIHAFAGNDPQAEAGRVAQLVRKALAETDDGTVAILARARSHLQAIALALKAAGLAFQAVEVDPLGQEPVVQDLHNLSRALLHPADRLAWLVVLRAPWLGLDLTDLLVIAEPSPRCVLTRLRDPAVRAALSADGRARVERLLRVVERELPTRGRRPLRQWVEGIWLALGGLAAATPAAMNDAQAYLALLDAHEQAAGLLDFAQLDAALAGLYAAPDSRADLPGLGRRPRSSTSELLYWLERTGSDGRTRLLMAPIRAAGQAGEPISDYLRELDREKNRLETARLLYVATTRARRRLHLLGHIGFNQKGEAGKAAADSLLEKLWPVVEPAFAALSAPAVEATGAPAASLTGLQRLPADWRPAWHADPAEPAAQAEAEQAAATIEFEWAGDTARHVGTLVHRYLERIAMDGIEQWPEARAATLATTLRRGLQNLGVPEDELGAATEKALRALQQTLSDATGRWILSPHPEARCEWALTLHEQSMGHYVIDRTFIDDQGIRWIIDYKTGEHLAGDRTAFLDREQLRYREQLETYGRIVRLLEGRPIRLALYFPLFGDWRVWDYEG
jgi:ATP-dependent helicase/nuclease subunit A